jgi:hypothetical protein
MTRPTDPNARLMKRWLPPMWYDQSQATNALIEAEGEGLTQYQQDMADVNAARMPQTAPDWGIERFEEELGLPVAPPGLTVDDRRAIVLAKFRGIGTTIYRLKQIASTFGYGHIAILPGVEDWTLYIQFIDVIGVPAALSAHEAAIRDNVEAHLDTRWAFHFTLWRDVTNTGVLWCQLLINGNTWDSMKNTPYQNMPTTTPCTGQAAGTLTIEFIDQTGYAMLALRYLQPVVTGNVVSGTTDPVAFPLT